MLSLTWIDYPRNVLELVEMTRATNPYEEWGAICSGLKREIRAASAARLEGFASYSEIVAAAYAAPYDVDLEICRITVGGKSYGVAPEVARMARLLVDAEGEWVPMSKNGFSKPSGTKKKLPIELRLMIETDKGKGYRLRPNS